MEHEQLAYYAPSVSSGGGGGSSTIGRQLQAKRYENTMRY